MTNTQLTKLAEKFVGLTKWKDECELTGTDCDSVKAKMKEIRSIVVEEGQVEEFRTIIETTKFKGDE